MSARASLPVGGHDFSRFRDVQHFGQAVTSMNRASVMLSIWGRLAATRDLQEFLVGVAAELTPSIDLQGIGAVAFAPHAGFRLLAGWNALVEREANETADALHRRTLDAVGAHMPARARVPYDVEMFRRMQEGLAVSCDDLLAKDAWYEYEFALAASGMRAYLSIPLFDNGQLTGLAVFTRHAARAFCSDETRPLPTPLAQSALRLRARSQTKRLRGCATG